MEDLVKLEVFDKYKEIKWGEEKRKICKSCDNVIFEGGVC
jgi:hypothetical protein